MLFKKNAEDVKLKVEEVGSTFNRRFEELQTLLKEYSLTHDNRFNALEIQLQQLTTRFAGEAEKLAVHLHAIVKAREDVEKSTRSFGDVQKKVETMMDEQLGVVIRESIEKLKLDAGQYAQVKREIEQISVRLNELSEQVLKFMRIAEEIKHADFQLGKYAAELEKADNEKVKLMKEVDDLQRLVARMRRGNN